MVKRLVLIQWCLSDLAAAFFLLSLCSYFLSLTFDGDTETMCKYYLKYQWMTVISCICNLFHCFVFLLRSKYIISHYSLAWSRFCFFSFLIDFDSVFEKSRNLDFNVDFWWLTFINFWLLHNTTILEALTSFVTINPVYDNGGNNNSL